MGGSSSAPGAKPDRGGAHTRRSWSLKVYLLGLVMLFIVAASADVAYQRRAASDDARQKATADARFGAEVAARDLATALGLVQTQLATVAASPGIEQLFVASANCTLNFGGAGALRGGHLDIVRADGMVVCSSSDSGPTQPYAGESWLRAALTNPAVATPVVDARTGKQVVVSSAPIGGQGAVVAFLELDGLGPELTSTLGGPRHLEFTVTTADDTVVLARSIDPQRWVGTSPANTPFAGVDGAAEHRDLDGKTRFYGQGTVDGVGWTVFAGASKSDALATATTISNRQGTIVLAGLAVFLGMVLVIYRRIARPIRQLSSGVRAATAHMSSGPIAVSGPAEVETLVDDFNQLIASANREIEATTRLAAIVESSADAIIGATLDGVITSWNARAEEMYGYSADEMVGHTVATIVVPTDRLSEVSPILERVRQGGRMEQFETKRVRKDGTSFDVSMTVSPVFDGTGALTGVSSASRDITDRRALEERVRQSERLESLGQLTGGIAHDFNNLLAAIMSYASFVADETVDQPAVHADVEQIQTAAERAARLVKQLLIFGRREDIRPETLDLNAIVADVRNLLSRSIGEHIELVVDAASALPTINADRGQIEQVLVNLAVNARDAMPQGGTLTIETDAVDLDEGYAHLHPDVRPGQFVELAVSDTGTGMSREVADRIFEPFFTTKARGEGTGLGLATVYGIVAEAGGSMSVYSEEGLGTTFRLYLPAADGEADSTAPETASVPVGQGQTVLLVEDEPAVLELTARILRSSGYVVLEAATFDAALALATAHDFQLLLTDSVMPHMSGPVLAEQIGKLRPGRPVLYMSGYSPGVIGPRGILEKGAAFVQKPFNRRVLLEKVHAVLA